MKCIIRLYITHLNRCHIQRPEKGLYIYSHKFLLYVLPIRNYFSKVYVKILLGHKLKFFTAIKLNFAVPVYYTKIKHSNHLKKSLQFVKSQQKLAVCISSNSFESKIVVCLLVTKNIEHQTYTFNVKQHGYQLGNGINSSYKNIINSLKVSIFEIYSFIFYILKNTRVRRYIYNKDFFQQ